MRKRNFERFVFVVFFSVVFSFIPWEGIWNSTHGGNFNDREVYRDMFLNGSYHADACSFSDVIGCITSERLWSYGVGFLLEQGMHLEHIFQWVSFLLVLAFCCFLTIKNTATWPVFLLFNPLVVDLAFSQLRLSLALVFLYCSYLSSSKSMRMLLALCSFFVHTASIVFFLIYIVARLSAKEFTIARGKLFVIFLLISAGGAFSVLLGPLRELILSFLGDRRAQYQYFSGSVLYSLFWVGLLGLSLFQRSNFFHRLENRFSIIILSMVAFNILFSGYSTRFLAASFPAIISYMLNLRDEYRVVAFLIFFCYGYAQWVFWLFVSGN